MVIVIISFNCFDQVACRYLVGALGAELELWSRGAVAGPESGQGLETERSPRCSPQSEAGENLGRMCVIFSHMANVCSVALKETSCFCLLRTPVRQMLGELGSCERNTIGSLPRVPFR